MKCQYRPLSGEPSREFYEVCPIRLHLQRAGVEVRGYAVRQALLLK